jgi:hypothetical protein
MPVRKVERRIASTNNKKARLTYPALPPEQTGGMK